MSTKFKVFDAIKSFLSKVLDDWNRDDKQDLVVFPRGLLPPSPNIAFQSIRQPRTNFLSSFVLS